MTLQAPRAAIPTPTLLNLELVRQEAPRRPRNALVLRPELLMERAGVRCAGAHLIVDLYGARRLDDVPFVEQTLRDCVIAAGATLLHIHLHRCEPNGGISGVAVLVENHIAIRAWPEIEYAALDIFMSGEAQPQRCIEILLEAFTPRRVTLEELLRGRNV